MTGFTKLTLDVLKAHRPNVVEFAQSLSASAPDCEFSVRVLEMDDKTESLEVVVNAMITDLSNTRHGVAARVAPIAIAAVVNGHGSSRSQSSFYSESTSARSASASGSPPACGPFSSPRSRPGSSC